MNLLELTEEENEKLKGLQNKVQRKVYNGFVYLIQIAYKNGAIDAISKQIDKIDKTKENENNQ